MKYYEKDFVKACGVYKDKMVQEIEFLTVKYNLNQDLIQLKRLAGNDENDQTIFRLTNENIDLERDIKQIIQQASVLETIFDQLGA